MYETTKPDINALVNVRQQSQSLLCSWPAPAEKN